MSFNIDDIRSAISEKEAELTAGKMLEINKLKNSIENLIECTEERILSRLQSFEFKKELKDKIKEAYGKKYCHIKVIDINEDDYFLKFKNQYYLCNLYKKRIYDDRFVLEKALKTLYPTLTDTQLKYMNNGYCIDSKINNWKVTNSDYSCTSITILNILISFHNLYNKIKQFINIQYEGYYDGGEYGFTIELN